MGGAERFWNVHPQKLDHKIFEDGLSAKIGSLENFRLYDSNCISYPEGLMIITHAHLPSLCVLYQPTEHWNPAKRDYMARMWDYVGKRKNAHTCKITGTSRTGISYPNIIYSLYIGWFWKGVKPSPIDLCNFETQSFKVAYHPKGATCTSGLSVSL